MIHDQTRTAQRSTKPRAARTSKLPLAEQSLADLQSYFCGQAAITYILHARDDAGEEIYSAGPDPITALALIPTALGWRDFRSANASVPADPAALHTHVYQLAHELTRRGCRYSLFWHAAGDKDVCFASSHAEPFAAIELELVDAVVHDIADYLYGFAG